MLHHSGSSLRFPNGRSMPRARTPTLHHRAHLGAVSRPPARAKDEPSARMPPLSHPREGRLREDGAGVGLRLRLREDRRRVLLGEHAQAQARRVDRAGGDGAAQAELPGGLRPPHRPGAFGGGRRLLYHQGSLRGREGREEPGGPRKTGIKRSMAVDAKGIPLGAVSAPANRHDSPLLVPTLKATSEALGALPEETSIQLDRGYDSRLTRERLAQLGLGWEISQKGKPAPYWATNRWVVERTSAWHNAHKKLVWCTERVGRVIDFWVAFSEVVIIVRRLIREAWRCYRWEGRPSRRP